MSSALRNVHDLHVSKTQVHACRRTTHFHLTWRSSHSSPVLPCLRGSSCSFQAASTCFSSRLHARLMSEPSALYSRQLVQTCTHDQTFMLKCSMLNTVQAASTCFSSRLHARLMSEPSALYSRQLVQPCMHKNTFLALRGVQPAIAQNLSIRRPLSLCHTSVWSPAHTLYCLAPPFRQAHCKDCKREALPDIECPYRL